MHALQLYFNTLVQVLQAPEVIILARPKNIKTIKVTLEVEPPYTGFAVLTFCGGGEAKGTYVTSKAVQLKNGTVIHVGEHGGIQEMTAKEAKRRRGDLQEPEPEE